MGIFATNNNTDPLSPKDDSLSVLNEIISHFIAPVNPATPAITWFTEIARAEEAGRVYAIILESAAVDPIVGNEAALGVTDENGVVVSQKWRLMIAGTIHPVDRHIETVRVFWGSNLQIRSDMIAANAVAYLPSSDVPAITLWDASTRPRQTMSFISYALTMVPRGFALSVWRNFQSNAIRPTNLDGTYANTGNVLLCIQRPVDPLTGQIKPPPPANPQKGKLPVMALSIEGTSTAGREGRLSIVRERDINASSPMRDISEPGIYTLYGINLNWTHPNILSNNTHVVKIPFGLCTDRHIYPEELDLIAFTHATSFITYQAADLTMYGSTRQYTGTWGAVEYNYDTEEGRKQILGGSRICLLSDGVDF